MVYYGLKIIAKWYGPKLFNYAARKTEEKFKERFEGFAQEHTVQEEQIGEVTIKKKTAQKNTSKEPVGEYIEFEELE